MRPQTFIATFWKTVSDVQYYKEILQSHMLFSLRFFVVSMLLLGLVVGTITMARDARFWMRAAADAQKELAQRFPTNLTVRWNGSELTSSQSPLTVPYPSALVDQAREYQFPEHLAVLDQSVQPSNTDAQFIIGNRVLFIPIGPDQFQQLELSSLLPNSSFQIDQTNIDPLSKQLLDDSLLPLLTFFAVIRVVFFTLSLILSGLVIAAVESAFIFLALTLLGRKLSYAKIWQLSLHVLVLAEIVHQVASAFYPQSEVSWLSLSYWLLMTYVLFSVREVMTQKR